MKKGWSFIGFLFIVVVGTLLHFCYDWSGKNAIIGIFSAVNESTWEHLKLFYFPFIAFTLLEYFNYGNKISNFFNIKLKSLLISLAFITVFFYTYQGIVGFNIDALNIADFVIAAAIGRIYEKNARTYSGTENPIVSLPFWALIGIGILFVLFTCFTPKIGIFRDPQTLLYGY